MALFRLYLMAMLFGMIGYTAVTIANHGWNLLPVFFGDMAKMGWPGQFNFDFMMMLSLSALWTAWRHRFSASGIGLAILAFFGGALFLGAYLLWAMAGAKGNVRSLLLGEGRA